MKKIFLLASLLSIASYGASIDHIQTYSPDYLANQAQNGMLNGSSANYNPAGLSQLEKGKYIQAGLQFATGHETMEYNKKTHKAKLKQAIPNLALYSVDEKGATFLTFGGLAGGGKLKYDGASGVDVALDLYSTINPAIKGLQVYDKGSVVTGSNKYEQITLGRTFKIDEKLSFSAAARLVHGTRKLSGNINLGSKAREEYAALLKASINSKREAWGYAFQLGVNYKASEKLNLAARFDSRVKLNFKAKGNENVLTVPNSDPRQIVSLGFSGFYPQYTPKTKTRRDLPAILALGASYKATDNWTISTAANIYFNKWAKMDRVIDKSGHKHGKDYSNGWELALGNEYKLNDKFTLIGSINYAKTGAKKSSYNDTEYALNSTTLGAGIKYNYDETLTFGASVAHFMYDTAEGNFKEKYAPVIKENQKYKKSITAFGLSVTKKF